MLFISMLSLEYRFPRVPDIQVAATGMPSSGPVLLSALNLLKRDGDHSVFSNATVNETYFSSASATAT